MREGAVLVTGAGRRIGAAIARALHSAGMRVVLHCHRSRAEADFLAASLEAARPGSTAVLQADLLDVAALPALVERAAGAFGRLDALVNNAGLMGLGSVIDTTLEDWRRIHAVNLDGVFLGCKHALPGLERAGGGSIVNISSIAAMHGVPYLAAYCSSKGAVRSLTKAVAVHCREAKKGVRCNSVHPDGVKTPMVVKVATGQEQATRAEIEAIAGRSSRFCEPEDIAAVVLFLASDESRYVNGAEIMVDNAAVVVGPGPG